MKSTATIDVTWQDGILIAVCIDDPTLGSNVVPWTEPITASTDSHAIAQAVTEINGAAIISVEHDKDTVFVHVDNSTLDD